jgi:hypothetical protein
MTSCSFVRAAGCDTVARPAAATPVAFSALSPAASPEDCGDRMTLPFFDFLGVGAQHDRTLGVRVQFSILGGEGALDQRATIIMKDIVVFPE